MDSDDIDMGEFFGGAVARHHLPTNMETMLVSTGVPASGRGDCGMLAVKGGLMFDLHVTGGNTRGYPRNTLDSYDLMTAERAERGELTLWDV